MKLYSCYDNTDGDCHIDISEIKNNVASRFCVVKKYDVLYQEELPRFKKYPHRKYALPYNDIPSKTYHGLGLLGSDVKYLSKRYLKKSNITPEDFLLGDAYLRYNIDMEDLFRTEVDAEKWLSFMKNKDEYEILWTRLYDSSDEVPKGFNFIGYDVTSLPGFGGAFSAICDCMFICMWHGCDEEGTAFLEYFNKLNKYGLLDNANTAIDYLKYYMSFKWSERGDFCISEIFKKIEI